MKTFLSNTTAIISEPYSLYLARKRALVAHSEAQRKRRADLEKEQDERRARAEAAAIRKDARDSAMIKEARIRQRNALRWRNDGMTFREIGERFGVTVERARQIYMRGARRDAMADERVEDKLSTLRIQARMQLRNLNRRRNR